MSVGCVWLALLEVSILLVSCDATSTSGLRVYTARNILTMEPDAPAAAAVAVEIVALGSLDDVRAALGKRAFDVDERFADKVLLPGFIDPHLHPALAVTILPLNIVSAMEWVTPAGRTRPVRGRDSFLARLRELDHGLDDQDECLLETVLLLEFLEHLALRIINVPMAALDEVAQRVRFALHRTGRLLRTRHGPGLVR